MNRKSSVVVLFSLLALTLSAQPQIARQGSQQEQSSFGTEELPDVPRVKRPLPVPDAALQILRTDDEVKSCLEHNQLAPGQDLASWFTASEIHLDGPDEADLVVLPSFRGKEGMCFQSATGIGLFWIFRKNGKQYHLLLKTWGGGLEILRNRSNDYRDIQTGSLGQAGRYLTTVTFRFDGKRYQKYQERTEERN
ncbi:MAG: hypothetical protein ACLPLR_16360 [Terriglobales bacterium]